VRKERPDFNRREPVRCEHRERAPQEFICTRPEMIEMPTLLQNLGELANSAMGTKSGDSASSGFKPTETIGSAGSIRMSLSLTCRRSRRSFALTPWSRTRFRHWLNSIEFRRSQVIGVEGVAATTLWLFDLCCASVL